MNHDEIKLPELQTSKITLKNKVKKQKLELAKTLLTPISLKEQAVREPAPTQSLTRETSIMSPKSPKKPIQLIGLNKNDTEVELNLADIRAAS